MKKVLGFLLVVVLVGISSSLFAVEVLTHPEAQVQITVPDQWKQVQKEDVLEIYSPGDEMAVVFMILAPKEAEKALDQVDKELEKKLGEIKWENNGDSKPEEINGMKGEIWNGTAKEGKFQVECITLDTPSGKILGIYWFDTPESEVKFQKDIVTIVKGLKPVATNTPEPKEGKVGEDDEEDEDVEEGE
jgi:predicted Zn-dependent protease